MKTYTREQLLFYLNKFSHELKKTPTIKEMNSKKEYPSASTYSKRFGSWNNALKEADLKLNVRQQYTKKELSENLKLLAKELGRLPMSTDLKTKKWTASYTTYKKHFGSWNNALKSANLSKKIVQDLQSYVKRK